jgi:hypothetical protein
MDWQPIDTAPRDGSWFITARFAGDEAPEYGWRRTARWLTRWATTSCAARLPPAAAKRTGDRATLDAILPQYEMWRI